MECSPASAISLSIIAYNTNLVKAEDAPKSFADLLDPKWTGKIVKSHPGYSGSTMTATFQMQRDLGWNYFEKLAKQNVMQVQSSADPPKKLDLGERAIMADGNEYNLLQLHEAGRPVEPVYATEGSPLIIGPNGIFKAAPHPNAARLFQAFCFGREAQQLSIDVGGLRSVHPQTQEKPGRKPLREIKTMKDDAAAVETQGERDQGALQPDFPGLTAGHPHDVRRQLPSPKFSRPGSPRCSRASCRTQPDANAKISWSMSSDCASLRAMQITCVARFLPATMPVRAPRSATRAR